MTEIAKTLFDSHHIRKTKKQKLAFRDFVAEAIRAEGYDCHEEPATFGARNLVVGNPETARVVFTAHYDTCARMPVPNFITPTKIGIYLLYQIALSLVILLLPAVVWFVLGVAASLFGASMDTVAALIPPLYGFSLLAIMLFMMIGPANRHTANDNTSGVITLIELIHALPVEHRGMLPSSSLTLKRSDSSALPATTVNTRKPCKTPCSSISTAFRTGTICCSPFARKPPRMLRH